MMPGSETFRRRYGLQPSLRIRFWWWVQDISCRFRWHGVNSYATDRAFAEVDRLTAKARERR